MSEHLEQEELLPIIKRVWRKIENEDLVDSIVIKYAHIFSTFSKLMDEIPNSNIKDPLTGKILTSEEIKTDLMVKFFLVGYFIREEEVVKIN